MKSAGQMDFLPKWAVPNGWGQMGSTHGNWWFHLPDGGLQTDETNQTPYIELGGSGLLNERHLMEEPNRLRTSGVGIQFAKTNST